MSLRTAAYSLGMLLLGLTGCSATAADSETNADEVNASENTDVQVISAKSSGVLRFVAGSTYDARKCIYSDKRPADGRFTSTAKADCTDALISALGPTINRYIEPTAYLQESPELQYVELRHWCGAVEVVVGVKAAAWDSPSFKGVGFYAETAEITQGQTRVFYDKNDARLSRIGEATLKNENHAKVYLYKFFGAGPCETNGSGDNPRTSIVFKPYVTFDGDNERWEAVPGNHGLRYEQAWERRGDLLD